MLWEIFGAEFELSGCLSCMTRSQGPKRCFDFKLGMNDQGGSNFDFDATGCIPQFDSNHIFVLSSFLNVNIQISSSNIRWTMVRPVRMRSSKFEPKAEKSRSCVFNFFLIFKRHDYLTLLEVGITPLFGFEQSTVFWCINICWHIWLGSSSFTAFCASGNGIPISKEKRNNIPRTL